MLIPSIDIMDGLAVQLIQGKKKVLERKNVLGLAREFGRYGDIAVIDLDAALGRGDNTELIKKLCRIADCRVGGGINCIEKVNEFLRAGAKKIIIGTRTSPEFLKQIPKERLIVAIDTRNGYVVNKGWRNKTDKKPTESIKELQDYCSEFLFTNVDKEGLMLGCDIDAARLLKKETSNKLTIAGGIKSIEEIKEIDSMGLNCQLGMAIYNGGIDLAKSFSSILNFKKNKGLIPTIVQDTRKQVLMLAFSDKESLVKSLRTGNCTYYSRSRKKLWTKGETSGNFQELIRVDYDCDRDSLLFTVRQNNTACHTGKYSCFGEKIFDIEELYQILRDRITNKKEGSYTFSISKTETKIMEKILEECSEVINYKDRENLVYEISDLLYFLLVLMAKKGIGPDEIIDELWRRRK